jgi:hypothetical protein
MSTDLRGHPWVACFQKFPSLVQRVEEQTVLQMLSFGLKVKQCHVDRVNAATTRARRQTLLIALLDEAT